MTVADLVKSFMKTEMPIDRIWEKTQSICAQYGIDPANLDDANAQFVAGEIDKDNAGLAIVENNGQLATTEETKGKKNKKNTPANTANESDPIERLKPVVQNLYSTINDQTGALKQIVQRKVENVEDRIVNELVDLTDGMNANIVNKFRTKLEARVEETQSFLERFEGVFDETFGSF